MPAMGPIPESSGRAWMRQGTSSAPPVRRTPAKPRLPWRLRRALTWRAAC